MSKENVILESDNNINNKQNNNTPILKSIKGFNVVKHDFDKKLYLQYICAKENKINAELFASRNIKISDKDNFLNPKLKNLLPQIGVLKDTDIAVNRILEAIKNNEKICIFGDYDVDGTTSTSMLILFLEQLGVIANYYIPDRISEGYGPNENAFEKIAKNNVKLIICVDCGSTAFEPLKKVKELGVDVIVIDHHKTDEVLPECVALINPNRFDETEIPNELHHLCACGVSFLVLMALSYRLKQQNKTINLMQFIPLVAFATICDVMNLTNLNRAFIKTGINVLQKNKSFNLHELIKIAEASRPQNNTKFKNIELNAYTFGFLLGPMINAGGRIGNASLGVEMMIEKNKQVAQVIAQKLFDLNEERKEIENNVLEELKYQTENIKKQIEKQGFILLHSTEWHEGVIGLVASRLKEKFYYPVLAGSETVDGNIKLSCRSINGIDIGDIILQAKSKNLIINGGGHKLAGGITCNKDKLDDLIKFLTEKIKLNADINYQNKTEQYDVALTLNGLNLDLVEKVLQFEPFGIGNPKPIFLIQDVIIIQANIIKEKHISVILKDTEITQKAICFNCIGNELGKFLLSASGKKVSLLVTTDLSNFNNKPQISIKIEDAII